MCEQEADVKPVVPSRIPVGSFRVEEEKRINRALSREKSSGKLVRERSMSRIPVFSSRSSLIEPPAVEDRGRSLHRSSTNLSSSCSMSNSRIATRWQSKNDKMSQSAMSSNCRLVNHKNLYKVAELKQIFFDFLIFCDVISVGHRYILFKWTSEIKSNFEVLAKKKIQSNISTLTL